MRLGNRLLYFFVLIGCLINIPSHTQHLQKPFRILTTKDGLPQSFISGLVQDKEGFVWIGTRNGLARYDGMHFKLFQHKSNDSTTLASNLIISLSPAKNNCIWVEHESSNIDLFDPVTEIIEHITARPLFRSHPVVFIRRGWTTDSEDNLWCIQKSNGLYRYDWKNNKVRHFTSKIDGLPSDTIRGLLEDRQKNMWIVSQRGLSRYNTTDGSFTNIPVPAGMEFNIDANLDVEIIAIHERTNGEIMFGDRHQLFFYNPEKKSFRTLSLPGNPKQAIHAIQTGTDGNEYMESEGIVYRYNDRNSLIAIGDIGLTAFRNAQSFLIDRSGLIWLGTNAAGIHQIDLSAPFFESHSNAVSFHHDLLSQQFGIPMDQVFGWPLSDKEFNSSSYLFRSTYDSHKRLWMALRDRIGYYDTSKKNLVMLLPVPGIGDPANTARGIRGISFAPNGTLWIIGEIGYIGYFDSISQKWITFLDLSPIRETNPNFNLTDVLVDRDKIWITSASGEGLFCIDIRTKNIKRINRNHSPDLFPANLLLGLTPDPSREELLWIGSYEGLICLNKKTLKTEIFSIEQGLPDNTIYAIQTDKAGYLWLSTNKGLCRFHPITHQIRIFQNEDGLPGNEFNRFHSMRLPDGRLAFGGTDGWTLFDPTVIKPDNYQPPVSFTNLKINNEPVDHSVAKNLLPAPLNSLKVLSLPYDQNTLSFEFAGLEYNQPKKILYRYQLKNTDNKWIITDNPSINYTKLPPGHYTLNINASNTTGQWSSYIRTLLIVIRPPFWQTWWAYCLYMLFIAGLIWVYIRYRLNRERMQQEVFLKEREAMQLKTVDELKTRFFSNITHEFRTPLTLILIPVQRLKFILKRPESLRWVSAIERNANQLLKLINQLLDFSKLESGTLKVNETRGSICDAIEEFLRSFYHEAEANGIQLKLKTRCDFGEYWFDADKLEQIIRNLVANALKFTGKDGKVEIVCETESAFVDEDNPIGEKKGGLFITVRDTGIGIPGEQLPFIFNRFYQIDNVSAGRQPANNSKGSGIGLALVKELVDLQGGTIEVRSPQTDEANWHTIFDIWLPYRQAIPGDGFTNEKSIELTTEVLNNNFASSEDSPVFKSSVEEEKESASILLIEDNDELAEFIADSLPKSYSTRRASNGAEGLEKSFELMPDLVISDVLMPVMDGYEFCSKIKSDNRTNHIPIILLTARATFENRIEGLSLGADDYLTKPFHIKELQLRVRNLLERQRLIREKLRLQLSQPDDAENELDGKTPTEFQDAFIKKLYELIEENLDDTSFGVQELANKIGLSRSNLYNKLKTLTGLPAGDIIKNYRLKRAAQFLRDGNNSSETSYKVGFDSPAYFSKCFREFYKATPMEFIEKG